MRKPSHGFFSAGCGKAVKVKDKLGDVETMSEATKPADCGGNCESCGADCSSRQQDMHIPLNQYSTVRKVIGIVSGKGGVGKSLVTSLTACAMQSRGYATAVFDADVTGPSIPKARHYGKGKGQRARPPAGKIQDGH